MSEGTKHFAVIVFNNDNSVSAVPSSWISSDDRSCAWPLKYPVNFKKLIRQPNSKPDADWMWLGVEVKKRYDSFDVADGKTRKYLKDDAVASCSEIDTPKSSRRKKAKREANKTTGEFVEPHDSVHAGLDDIQSAPNQTSFQTNQTGELGLTFGQIPPPINQCMSPAILEQESSLPAFSTTDGNVSFTVVDQVLSDEMSNLRKEFRNFQEIVLKKLELLATEQRETKKLLLTVVSNQSGPLIVSEQSKIFQLIPVQNECDYDQLETELKAKEDDSQRLVNFLKRGGGSSLPDNVYNILRCLFTDEMSKKLRLTSSSGKLGFRESKIAQCVREAVHSSYRTDKSVSTDKLINQYIGCWFRQRGYVRNAKSLCPVTMGENASGQEIRGRFVEGDKSGSPSTSTHSALDNLPIH